VSWARRIAEILFNSPPEPRSDPLDRSLLFTGEAGVGKTSLALALAAHYTGEDLERLWLRQGFHVEQTNGQSLTADLVRRWMENGRYIPLAGWRVQIVDEIDAGSLAAMNEFRTYADSLPPATLFIATTNREPHHLQVQLQSRFQVYYFEPVPVETLSAHLASQFSLAMDAARQVAEGAACLRDGIIIGCNVRAAIADAKALRRAMV
jgi:DNA polymerase III delta prime subunit